MISEKKNSHLEISKISFQISKEMIILTWLLEQQKETVFQNIQIVWFLSYYHKLTKMKTENINETNYITKKLTTVWLS